MSWHNRDCGIPDLDWTDGYPTCIRCSSSASSIADCATGTPSRPAPPPSLKRSQLKCSWPPCVRYSERFIDDEGNDLTEFIIENIDGWNIDTIYLPDDRAKLQEAKDASPRTDSSSEAPELSKTSSNVTNTNTSDGCTKTTRQKLHTVVPAPTSTQRFNQIHEPLRSSDYLRLIRLHGSASSDDPIHCSLEVAQLDDPDIPLYDALSYTWADIDGNNQNCRPIYIGSHFDMLFITKNCESALQKLRKSTDRVLWIDAICINQNDPRERSEQVNHMAEIYSRASRVRIYLGEESSNSGEALKAAAAYSQSSTLETHRASLVELSKRPYFQRLWIIQEVALAIKASVTCGGSTVYWTDLCSALQSCELAPVWMKHVVGPVHKRRWDTSLLQLLLDTKDALCIDPRDKLFAIIGLARTKEREWLPTDYSLSVQEVYTGLAAYWILIYGSCSFLNLACNQKKTIPGLPSWVPDWTNIETQENGGVMPLLFIRSPYAAFPPLLWRHDAGQKLRSISLNASFSHYFGRSCPPIVQSTVGALLVYAVPLFEIIRGELKTTGVVDTMRITKWHMHHDSKLLNNTDEFGVFMIPSFHEIVILKKHNTRFFSLQGIVSLFLEPLKQDTALRVLSSRLSSRIHSEEIRNLKRWLRVMLGLHLCSNLTHQDSAQGRSANKAAIFPDLSCLRNVEESLREKHEISGQFGFNSSCFKAMDLMRTIMVNAINPEDLAWHSLIHLKFRRRRWSRFRIPLGEVKRFAEELPIRQNSVEEQISLWSSSVTQLSSQLQEQGPFSDAFRDLQADETFHPLFWVNSSQWNEDYDVMIKVLGMRGGPEGVHLSLFIQKAFDVISCATLDENLPWAYNRDRFWMCMVSFDLIVRLRLLLADRQLYSRIGHSIETSVENPKQIVIV